MKSTGGRNFPLTIANPGVSILDMNDAAETTAQIANILRSGRGIATRMGTGELDEPWVTATRDGSSYYVRFFDGTLCTSTLRQSASAAAAEFVRLVGEDDALTAIIDVAFPA